MPDSIRTRIDALAIVAATVALPLLGAWIGGRPLEGIFRFPPPLQIPSTPPRFSWSAVGLVVLPFAALGASWAFAWAGGRRRARLATRDSLDLNPDASQPAAAGPPPARTRFPWWGWVAIGWTLLWWLLAWTRFPGFSAGQHYTFFPLWLGFIVTVNALTHARTGACLMRRSPATWFGLFGVSAGFWWVFEWLNRFVHNWHYLGVSDFGPVAYSLHASVCFSTVLPAVASVQEWLASHGGWQRRCVNGPRWPWLAHRATGVLLIAGGILALGFTGVRPEEFYPALWAAPLALALGQSVLARRPGVAGELAAGDWRGAARWAGAALICGFFWELWNVRSEAKWIYTVPYVDRWHVFEMPLLGYLGYLPFGLECLLVVEYAFGRVTSKEPH